MYSSPRNLALPQSQRQPLSWFYSTVPSRLAHSRAALALASQSRADAICWDHTGLFADFYSFFLVFEELSQKKAGRIDWRLPGSSHQTFGVWLLFRGLLPLASGCLKRPDLKRGHPSDDPAAINRSPVQVSQLQTSCLAAYNRQSQSADVPNYGPRDDGRIWYQRRHSNVHQVPSADKDPAPIR